MEHRAGGQENVGGASYSGGVSQSREKSRSRELDVAVDAVVEKALTTGATTLRIVDLGGGTGGQAVRLATAGHEVTVVDPSPDALAGAGRRAAEAGLVPGSGGSLQGVQGDAETVAESLGSGVADVVLCHGVLEFVDDPAVALASIAQVLRRGGLLSLQVTHRDGSVVAAIAKGHLRHAMSIMESPDGRWGPNDPLKRRFSPEQVMVLLADNGFEVSDLQGLRAFSEVAPQLESESDLQLLETLNDHAAQQGSMLPVSPVLHITAAATSQQRHAWTET